MSNSETPYIFGKPMELVSMRGNFWMLEVAGITANIRRLHKDLPRPWQAFLSTPYGSDGLCETMQEAVEFLEAELRKMRARFVEEVPGP